MPLKQFLVIQGMLFGLFIISIYITGGAPTLFANVVMNFLTFFSGGWLITMLVRDRFHIIMHVLSATLSFNLVTYLLSLGMGAKLPPYLQLTGDFIIVTLFSLTGMYARLRWERKQNQE